MTGASVTKQRSTLTQDLQLASKQYGADPQFNPRLATVITAAKKQGFPKASIENAIARGQGRSPTGAALESLTIEAMLPPSVAVIVECQTDSKARTLGDMKLAIKESGGSMTPTSHMFDRKGKIVFEGSKDIGEEEIFDHAIEAGAIDVQMEDEGKVVVYAESSQTTAVAENLVNSSGLKVESLDIVWDPKEDMMVDVASPEMLDSFLGGCNHIRPFNTPGSPWSMKLVLLGLGLALTVQGARTEQKDSHQERELNTKDLVAEETDQIEEKSDDDGPEKEEDADFMDSAVDEEENGEDKNEQHDWKDIEEDEDDIQNCGKESEVSALAIIVPSQMVREIPRITIDKETGRIFNHMPFAERLRILAALAFAVTIWIFVIGFALWTMVQASENIIVTVVFET
ncbi:hypothetical protein HO133_000177 [Letharia lupina]|uniref:DUF28 domain-containing protein n=1 Tax=Letharia lupina TaxID=560253 RepID=A0A8H6CGV2_9LECA|nr:uncharacterized protein HO133_000177 [Letharia lupina]KAF6223335.1 hypothetical protein HO133_000177 [Letharia lupina]